MLLLLTAFIGRQIYKVVKKAKNSKVRIWTSLVVLFASITAYQGKYTWKNITLENSVMSASIYPDHHDIGKLKLIDEKKYYALYGHIDWSCSFTGTYAVKSDTLILGGEPFGKSDGILTDKYIMTDSTLIPIHYTKVGMDRAKILRIKTYPQ